MREIITDEVLYRLADNIPADKVQQIGAILHVPGTVISRIRMENPYSILDQAAKILQSWRDRLHKDHNWKEILLRAFVTCGLTQSMQDVHDGKQLCYLFLFIHCRIKLQKYSKN